jgi:hypothetical protein
MSGWVAITDTPMYIREGHSHTVSGLVVIADTPVYMCERGRGGWGGHGFRNDISTVIYTYIHQSRGHSHTMTGGL